MAQSAAQKKAAAAKKAAADKIIMDKAMQARGEARKIAAAKEKTYLASFENPITSQYDPRIAQNDPLTAQGGRIDSAGNVVKFNPEMVGMSGSTEKAPLELTVDLDAYAILEAAFSKYDLESLIPVIKGYMQKNIGANQANLLLKEEPLYKERFDGNTKRVAAGLNALDESTYLELENDYSETLNMYGLSDYFGVATDAASRRARQKKMAEVIGADISAVEFKSRISTATTRVKNADKNTKDAFKALYGIGDTELVKFFLDPKQGSEELKIKASAAEISGAAITTGLSGTSVGTAEELARLGVDKAEALTGYGTISGYLQRSGFLGDIYKESGITYGRADAESDVFKNMASATRKREQLKNLEESAFAGTSGRLRTGQQSGNTGQF